jgi:hypothetical protein
MALNAVLARAAVMEGAGEVGGDLFALAGPGVDANAIDGGAL